MSINWFVESDNATRARHLTFELSAPTAGWLAVGVRTIDSDAKMAHRDTRQFIAWMDDATGRTTVLDTVSNNESTPLVLPSSRTCIVASSVQGQQSASGVTSVRFSCVLHDGDAASAKVSMEIKLLLFFKKDDFSFARFENLTLYHSYLIAKADLSKLYVPTTPLLLQWAVGVSDNFRAENGSCPRNNRSMISGSLLLLLLLLLLLFFVTNCFDILVSFSKFTLLFDDDITGKNLVQIA